MIKDFFGILKDWGFATIVYGVGLFALTLFTLSLIPSLNFIPKLVLFFLLTH